MEILNLFYLQYIYFGPVFVIVLAISKFISKEKLRVNYFYSLSYIFMGLAMFQIVSYSTKSYQYYWLVSYFMIPVALVSPLLLYLRFRFLIQGKRIRIPVSSIIFIAVISLFILSGAIAGHRKTFTRENIELRPLLDSSFTVLPLYYKCVHVINFIAKIILGSGLLLLLARTRFLWEKKNTNSMMLARISYIFTILMFSTAVMLIIGDIVNFEFSKAAIAMVNTVTLGVFFASQYDPDYYVIFKHIKKKKKYESSKLKGIDVEAIIEKLNTIMTQNELYKEENITLGAVAKMTDINTQQLSEILNNKLNKSFNTYINDFKIDEAKKLLRGKPEYQVTRIALMAGFNTARTFNRVFRKSTGYTPQEYRKQSKGHKIY